MTKAQPRPGEAGTDAVGTASGQVTRSAGLVTPGRSGAVVHRVVPAHLACRVGVRTRAGERNAWPAVASIALGSLALVFSEVIPVGLLGDISGHLGVSVGAGGLAWAGSGCSAPGGVIYDAKGPGGVLVLAVVAAAAGSLSLLGRSGAAISSPPAGRRPGPQHAEVTRSRPYRGRYQEGRNCHAQRDCDVRVRTA